MVYLDTSAAVPLFVQEPASDSVAAWFAACAEPMVAADWIVTEFASALSLKERRGDISAESAGLAWAEFEAFCGTGLRLVPVSRKSFEEAARMVREVASGLRSGDSLHLAVALEIGASSMATADANLDANARKKGLDIIRF
jgi:uncharacterized protein